MFVSELYQFFSCLFQVLEPTCKVFFATTVKEPRISALLSSCSPVMKSADIDLESFQ